MEGFNIEKPLPVMDSNGDAFRGSLSLFLSTLFSVNILESKGQWLDNWIRYLGSFPESLKSTERY